MIDVTLINFILIYLRWLSHCRHWTSISCGDRTIPRWPHLFFSFRIILPPSGIVWSPHDIEDHTQSLSMDWVMKTSMLCPTGILNVFIHGGSWSNSSRSISSSSILDGCLLLGTEPWYHVENMTNKVPSSLSLPFWFFIFFYFRKKENFSHYGN